MSERRVVKFELIVWEALILRKTAVVLFAALSRWACGLPTSKGTTSGSTSGGSSGGSSGSCTLTTTFNTVGQLGEIQFTQYSGTTARRVSLAGAPTSVWREAR
jgi:hypothetical protein